MSSYILDAVRQAKDKLLTVKFDLGTLAEYYAAVEFKRARSVSEHVHQLAIKTIDEVKKEVSPQEFAAMVELKTNEILARSKQKSKEARRLKTTKKESGKGSKAA